MAERPDRPSWSDERLGAAFAALVPASAPPDTMAGVRGALADDTSRHRRRFGFILAGVSVAITAVVATGVVIGPWLVRGGPVAGTWYRVEAADGGTSTFLTDEFRFDFPSTWTVTDTAVAFSGGSSIAVLGTLPVPAACGTTHAGINCVYEQPLEAGTVRVFVGTRGFRADSILDRPDIENGTTRRLSVGGMPAILDEYAATPEDFYRSDLTVSWTIAFPASLTNAVVIEVMARDPGSSEARAAADSLIGSFAFNRLPSTLPPDDARGIALAHAAIATAGADFSRGFGQIAGENHLTCQPDAPGIPRDAVITFSSGGDLGGGVPVTCSWTLAREGDVLWRVETSVDWAIDGRSGRGTETFWLDTDGAVVRQVSGGENPPLERSDAPASPSPVASGTGMHVLGLPVLSVDVKTADGRESAVRSSTDRAWHGCVPTRQLTCRARRQKRRSCAEVCGDTPVLARSGPALGWSIRSPRQTPTRPA